MITKDLNKAVETVVNNDIVALPTETVYGLAGNASSEFALKKIFELKKRPHFNPLIVHIKSIDVLDTVAKDIPEIAIQLGKKFWPGPLTLVLKKQDCIPDLVTSGKDTVAVRVPNHPLTLELLQKIDFPLAAPSANPFGSISPTSAEHVFNYFGEKLDVILDGGNCEKGIESTIIGFENNLPVLYRLGSISIEDIEIEAGKISLLDSLEKEIKSPGMLDKHYAPRTKTYLSSDVNEMIKQHPNKKIGLLMFKSKIEIKENIVQKILSPTGDFKEAAKNLYEYLHQLDQMNLDMIITEKLPDKDLGKSINDRLQRAAK